MYRGTLLASYIKFERNALQNVYYFYRKFERFWDRFFIILFTYYYIQSSSHEALNNILEVSQYFWSSGTSFLIGACSIENISATISSKWHFDFIERILTSIAIYCARQSKEIIKTHCIQTHAYYCETTD